MAGRHVFDQGLGRSLWFVEGADVSKIRATVRGFPAARRAEEIFEGADTQTMDVQRMVESMDEIARVANQNAQSIDAVSESADLQTSSVTRNVESARQLSALAERMKDLLRHFQTGSMS